MLSSPEETGPRPEEEGQHLLIMDPPMHSQYRRLVSSRFTPRALQALHGDIDEIATGLLDEIATDGEWGEVDFVEKVSSVLPLAVIADMLGVPRSDWKMMFQWTNEMIGSGDPEYRREGETPDDTLSASPTRSVRILLPHGRGATPKPA